MIHWDELSLAEQILRIEQSKWNCNPETIIYVFQTEEALRTFFTGSGMLLQKGELEQDEKLPLFGPIGFLRYRLKWAEGLEKPEGIEGDIAYKCMQCFQIVAGAPRLKAYTNKNGVACLEYYCRNDECGRMMLVRNVKPKNRG